MSHGASVATLRRIEAILANWERKAQVRASIEQAEHDPGKPDFLVSLLPFASHPRFHELDERARTTVLSCAWLAFNDKQIDLERHVVIPACLDLLRGELPGAGAPSWQLALAATMTDESFHMLLLQRASALTRTLRGVGAIRIPRTAVVARMEARQAELSDASDRRLVRFATAVVTEVFICGYLRAMSRAEGVQAMNVAACRAHLADELTHGSIFRGLVEAVHARLGAPDRELFATTLACAVAWFAETERELWTAILKHASCPAPDDLIGDLPRAEMHVDYAPLVTMCSDIGIENLRERVASHAAAIGVSAWS